MLNDLDVESLKKWAMFYGYQNHILTFASCLEAPLQLIGSHTKKNSGVLPVRIRGFIIWKFTVVYS